MSHSNARPLSARFTEALVGATQLHAGQRRKGTDTPAIAHLLGVAGIALEFGAGEDEAIAALLHDAIEDAPPALGPDWVRRWILHRFGPLVLAIVEGCTDTDEQPKPAWRARKERYIARLADEDERTILVSASDKLHNVRAILTDVRTRGDAVFERFNKDAGKAGTMWYYRSLVMAYEARVVALAVEEGRGTRPRPYTGSDQARHHTGSDRLARLRPLLRELDLAVSALEEAARVPRAMPQ